MKRLFSLLALTLPLLTQAGLAQESFDFKTLDRLGINAKDHTSVTLDADMLKLAANFLGSDKDADSIRPLVESLKGIYIRSFAYDKEGQYNQADLEPLRTYLKQVRWTKIVESQQGKDISEVYLLRQTSATGAGSIGGVAILAADPKEVTVVYISGNLKPEDLAKLSGTMGIPNLPDLKKADKTKKDDE